MTQKKFNFTNDSISWAKWSWNPVTGCLHDCKYCYARDIANRFTGHFKPEFHEDRLTAPYCTKIPKNRINESGIQNVFVCSMADLFGCYDAKTEVLTKIGWKFFKDLTYVDELAYLDLKNDTLRYSKPISLTRIPYKGKMYSIKARSINLLVTPNHKMFVALHPTTTENRDNNVKEFVLNQAKDIYHKTVYYKRDFQWKGDDIEFVEIVGTKKEYLERETIPKKDVILKNDLISCRCGCEKQLERYDDRGRERFYVYGHSSREERTSKTLKIPIKIWLEFFGYWLSEGSIQINDHHYRTKVFQKENGKYYPKIVNNITALAQTINSSPLFDKGAMIINNKTLTLYLFQFGHAHEKYIPVEIKQLSSSLLKMLLSALVIGDGHQHNLKSEGFSYHTTSKRLADDVHEIALKSGYVASISERDPRTHTCKNNGRTIKGNHKQYQVIIGSTSRNPEINFNRTRKRECSQVESWEHYDGMVYCAEVSSHILYVRRNGKSCWCGNSWVPDKWIQRVMKQVEQTPQWNFLFLTKNPERYLTVDFPKNCWVGATADTQIRMDKALRVFAEMKEKKKKPTVTFISCEPLLERITFVSDALDWLIIGGRSKSSKMPAGQPEWEWVEHLLSQARQGGIKVYFKPNLTIRPEEYPKC